MPDYDLVATGGTVVTAEQGTFAADVAARDGRIAAVGAPGTLADAATETVDAHGRHVFPGVIDPHTHHGIAREFGLDAESESRAALAGGVTTIANMVLSADRRDPWCEVIPPILSAVDAKYHHDYYPVLAPLTHGHVEELSYAVEDLGVREFKWFNNLKQSDGLTEDIADAAIRALADLDVPTTLGFHSENTEVTSRLRKRLKAEGADGYEALVEAFPGYAEAQSLAAGAALAAQHGYDDRFYAVHVSSKRTVEELRRLHGAGYDVVAETCPHYLTLTTGECDDLMKINPPIRGDEDRDTLWAALADGTISCVGSDHCVKPMPGKLGDTIWASENAFPGSETILPLLLSAGYHGGRLSLEQIAAVTSANVAKTWNLYPKKGAIRVGSDADLVVVDLEETRTVTPERLGGAAGYSVYEGRSVTGWPTHTVSRGRLAYAEGEVLASPGDGERVPRPVDGA